MNIFDFLRGKKTSSAMSEESKLHFEFRGEGITYRLLDKHMHLSFTWINGARIYTETISKWENGAVLTTDERKRVFSEVVQFVGRKNEKPIIVINSDDPSKDLWEELCAINHPFIKAIEYTSTEKQYELEREMHLGILKAGKQLILDGIEIKNEEDLDEVMTKRKKSNAA